MLGDRIKAFRAAKGWTQGVLAEKLDVSIGYISEIETGRRTPSLACALEMISLLGCSPNELFEYVEEKPANKCAGCEFDHADSTVKAVAKMMAEMSPEERFKVFTYAKDQQCLYSYRKQEAEAK